MCCVCSAYIFVCKMHESNVNYVLSVFVCKCFYVMMGWLLVVFDVVSGLCLCFVCVCFSFFFFTPLKKEMMERRSEVSGFIFAIFCRSFLPFCIYVQTRNYHTRDKQTSNTKPHMHTRDYNGNASATAEPFSRRSRA